jgi:hypothetical protein
VARSIDNRHFRNEAITAFWKCLNISGTFGRVAQRISELRYGDVDSLVKITKILVRPDPVPQLLPGDDFSGPLQQYLQQFHGLLLDPDFHTRFAYFVRSERNLKSSEPNDGSLPQ